MRTVHRGSCVILLLFVLSGFYEEDISCGHNSISVARGLGVRIYPGREEARVVVGSGYLLVIDLTFSWPLAWDEIPSWGYIFVLSCESMCCRDRSEVVPVVVVRKCVCPGELPNDTTC